MFDQAGSFAPTYARHGSIDPQVPPVRFAARIHPIRRGVRIVTEAKGLTRVENILAWAERSNQPDAHKIKIVIDTAREACQAIRKAQATRIPENYTLAALLDSCTELADGNWVINNQNLFNWAMGKGKLEIGPVPHQEI